MTELEWCRANAPSAYDDVSDEDLVMYMHSAYLKFCADSADSTAIKQESVEYNKNDINEKLDYITLELTRVLGGNASFKGGYILTKLIPDRARQTTDVDLSIMRKELYEDVKAVLNNIANKFMTDGVIDSFKVKDNIEPFMSGGIDFYLDNVKILGVDVGLHDISYGVRRLSLDIGELQAFEVERMLADKITAILSRKRFRRPKDLYDLYCITDLMDFDARRVAEYILRRTDGVGADWKNYPFSDTVKVEYRKAYDKLTLNSIYTEVKLRRPPFDNAFDRFCDIAEKVHNPIISVYWSAADKCFK